MSGVEGVCHAGDSASLQARSDASATLLAGRGFSIPDADRADVLAAADELAAAVGRAVAALAPGVAPEPFADALLRLARPPLAGGHDATAAAGAGVAHSEDAVRTHLACIDMVAPGRLAWREIDVERALQRARQLDEERARGHVRGPLHGVVLGVKDMFDRLGRVAGWGSPLREGAAPAAADATVVARLEQAGAVILGTQHMAEFALSPTGLNATWGPGRNPWNVEHVSGGSSSGGGMTVGAGHVALAIGSDTGGSVRLPAALCGVTGLKPTQHRISVAGAMPLAPSLDCVGPLARSAELCAHAYVAMAGADSADPSCLAAAVVSPILDVPADCLSVAVPRFEVGTLLSRDMLVALEQATRSLADAGVRIVPVDLPDLDLPGRLASVLLATESAAVHRRWLEDQPERYGRQVRRRLSRGLLTASVDYYDALRLRAPLMRRFVERTLDGVDALLLPVTPDVAPRVVDTVGDDERRLEAEFAKLSFWTRGINYFGVPALAVPAGFGACGLPLGIQFVGPPLGEDRVLALGHCFQRHTRWHLRTPGDDRHAMNPAR
ncbi:amidase [Aromatoleum toluclasticum]|uniref:amidase n=1 Tax=Aromatoleum toluclasticum TaxID=92003 RepID=UPI001D195B13|nr:amidase [Aromatoleum toluclasticum]MCC4118510.1 amidase [Aromatoleum toluclasticum]